MNIEELPNTTEEQPFAKDKWVTAYMKGNYILPQNLELVNMYVANSLLNDATPDFINFTRSQLSPEQLTRVGKVMTAVHAVRGVDVGTEEGIKYFRGTQDKKRKISPSTPETLNFNTVLDEQLFQKFWTGIKANVILKITQVCRLLRDVDPLIYLGTIPPQAVMNAATEMSKSNLEVLTILVTKIVEFFETEEARNTLAELRKLLPKKNTRESRIASSSEVLKKLKESVFAYCNNDEQIKSKVGSKLYRAIKVLL